MSRSVELVTSPAQRQALEALLEQCTVNVREADRSLGSAFFVSNRHLLTCQHVVGARERVDLVTCAGLRLTASVGRPNPGMDDDLALLSVPLGAGDLEQPAVLLERNLVRGDFYFVGHPDEAGRPAGREGFVVSGHPRVEDGTPGILVIDPGQFITFGMSGGPVLDLVNGAVVGVMRTVRHPAGDLGGSAIPVSLGLGHYPEIADFATDAPVATGRWRRVLGRELWAVRGQRWDNSTDIDLELSGSRNAWNIVSAVSEEGVTRTASDLGDDLTEAMFRWALRRRLSAQEEVELLGRLLAKALFPSAVEQHLATLAEADKLTLRLRVAPGSGLEDVPWELAQDPASAGFVSALDHFRLVRVDSRATSLPRRPTSEQVRVLGVTALHSDRWSYPTGSYGDAAFAWPSRERIAETLAKNFRSPSYQYDTPEDESVVQLQRSLGRSRYDVVHYIGVGSVAKGRARISLADSEGDPYFQDLAEVVKWVREAEVRVLVLELTGPPLGQRLDPVSVSSLGELVGDGLEAVVLTRFPVHPRQLSVFNQHFYYALLEGHAIADAVQTARQQVQSSRVVDDWAGFGCFTLITDGGEDTRLHPQSTSAPGQPRQTTGTAKQPSTDTPSRTVVTDDFQVRRS